MKNTAHKNNLKKLKIDTIEEDGKNYEKKQEKLNCSLS